ncbi:MAG: 4Fe-4S dicluster domain-containing protein [Acidobacteriota bacterium]
MDRSSFLRKVLFLDVIDAARNGGTATTLEPSKTFRAARPRRVPFTFLRPPGALMEPAFLRTCTRCDKCIEVCPPAVIIRAEDPRMGTGTPVIDLGLGACDLCGKCVEACPEDALTDGEEEPMGLAIVHPDTCLSTHEPKCTACVDICPVGKTALELDTGRGILVHPEGCAGCGLCYSVCPTEPKSIHMVGRPPVPLEAHPPVPGSSA